MYILIGRTSPYTINMEKRPEEKLKLFGFLIVIVTLGRSEFPGGGGGGGETT